MPMIIIMTIITLCVLVKQNVRSCVLLYFSCPTIYFWCAIFDVVKYFLELTHAAAPSSGRRGLAREAVAAARVGSTPPRPAPPGPCWTCHGLTHIRTHRRAGFNISRCTNLWPCTGGLPAWERRCRTRFETLRQDQMFEYYFSD